MRIKKPNKYIRSIIAGNGCDVSPRDDRDYTVEIESKIEIPLSYRLPKKAKVLNQGSIGSCVPHSIATALVYAEYKKGFKRYHDFSRGYLYGNRLDTDTQNEGMIPRQALKSFNHNGDVLYTTFPWNMTYPKCKARIDAESNDRLEREAKNYLLGGYYRLKSEKEIKLFILRYGAVIISVPIYDTFGKHSINPGDNAQSSGNHMMCIVGWDNKGWIIQNSWSIFWGSLGYLKMDYDYPTNEVWGLTLSESITEPKKRFFLLRWIDSLVALWKRLFDKN